MLGRDVLVLETAHLVERRHQHGSQRAADGRFGDPDLLRTVLQPRVQARRKRLRRHLEPAQECGHEPLILLEQREQEMLGLDGGMLQLLGRLLGGGQSFLGALRESIQSHVRVNTTARRQLIFPDAHHRARQWQRLQRVRLQRRIPRGRARPGRLWRPGAGPGSPRRDVDPRHHAGAAHALPRGPQLHVAHRPRRASLCRAPRSQGR